LLRVRVKDYFVACPIARLSMLHKVHKCSTCVKAGSQWDRQRKIPLKAVKNFPRAAKFELRPQCSEATLHYNLTTIHSTDKMIPMIKILKYEKRG